MPQYKKTFDLMRCHYKAIKDKKFKDIDQRKGDIYSYVLLKKYYPWIQPDSYEPYKDISCEKEEKDQDLYTLINLMSL